MDLNTEALSTLLANYTLWIIILAVLYAFSLYVYFFPTPLSDFFYAEGFNGSYRGAVIR
jgi:hypothetical protein